MKILFVIDTLYTSNNGTSISAQRFAVELRKKGHEVRCLCSEPAGQEKYKHITDGDFIAGKVHVPVFQPLMDKHDFCFAKVNKRIIREACDWADIVHVFTPFPISVAAVNYCNSISKPVTAAFHIQAENITSSLGLGKVKWVNDCIYALFRKIVYNKVRHVHVPSQFMGSVLKKHHYTAKIHVISNGIQEDFIHAASERVLRPDSYNIMMIGRLSREKRQDVIMNAVQYSKYRDQIQLVFAGKGPEYNRYVKLCAKLGIQPRFLYLNREELIKQLLSTDLYIHASDMESEAISCIEAFATGLVPVIAHSDNSATPQFALDERSLFEAGNPKDLAKKMDYWFDHPEQRQSMGKQYQESAKHYLIAHSIDKFEQMLQEEAAI